METRRRKQADASFSAAPSDNPTAARTSKRPRSSTVSSDVMDSEHAHDHLRCFGKNNDRDKDLPSGKGKERVLPESSPHTREKEREAERIVGPSFISVSADDDNKNEGGVDILHQNFPSACSAVPGLLRIILDHSLLTPLCPF